MRLTLREAIQLALEKEFPLNKQDMVLDVMHVLEPFLADLNKIGIGEVDEEGRVI